MGSLPLTFYDSVTGKPLFKAPIGRSMEDFVAESKVHGWPSFRDQEVVLYWRLPLSQCFCVLITAKVFSEHDSS